MGFGSILKGIGTIGSAVAAPFTGGTSLSWIPALLGGAAAAGGALENRQGARTSTSTSTMTPTLAPEYQPLADLLRTRAMERLNSTIDMSGYRTSGIQGINDVFAGLNQSASNNLTSRGLGTSPVAATVGTNLDIARGGNIAEFLNSLPQLQRQFEAQDMGLAGDVLGFGRGTTTTGTNVGAGSAAGSAFSSGAEMLAYLQGRGLLGSGGGGTLGKVKRGQIPQLPTLPTVNVPITIPNPTFGG